MTQRIFIPGSEWLYFKLYTGIKTADELLSEAVLPYVQELHNEKLIDRWFFIRYSDPDFHIRFRLHIDDPAAYAEIFRRFAQHFEPQVERGAIAKVMCDTYVREIERYGEQTMTLCEEIFRIDSEAVLQLLTTLSGLPTQTRETLRWQMAFILLDDTLTAFALDLPGKGKMMAGRADNFRKEFGFTTSTFTKQLNDKYRALRKEIDGVLAPAREQFAAYEAVLQTRREQIAAIAPKIEKVDDVLPSLLHMTMNRWFRANNRQHELVVYDFLNRYYESAQARAKKGM